MPDGSSKPKISPALDENPQENLTKLLDSVHAAARHFCALTSILMPQHVLVPG
jgi:hypothetical protein